MRTIQIKFDNDEVLTVEAAQISLTDPITGQLHPISLQNIDTARSAIKEYEKQRRDNESHVGHPNSSQPRSS